MRDRRKIEDIAVSLLISQDIAGEYSLSFFDYRRINTRGKAIIGSYSEYSRVVGEMPPCKTDGCTVKYGGNVLVLYNDGVKNSGRVFWTVAHELGHVYLRHNDDRRASEIEADRFAAALLMPEAVIRFLDRRMTRKMTAEEMGMYFPCSKTALAKRRREIVYDEPYEFSRREIMLINRMFYPETVMKNHDRVRCV